MPDALIDEAIALLQPSGNPFLDLCMLKGRFPGVKTRFCTEELKLAPMDLIKQPLLDEGFNVIDWIGERAQESAARAAKPPIQRIRYANGATRVLYRPIHQLKHEEVFAIAKRHGLPPNPLYLKGMGRVGCLPCIMAKKGEIRQIASRFPEEIERIERWEALVGRVSRRTSAEGAPATFFAAATIPGVGDGRAHIREVVDWSMTSHGGRNFDLLLAAEIKQAAEEGSMCESAYGLCE